VFEQFGDATRQWREVLAQQARFEAFEQPVEDEQGLQFASVEPEARQFIASSLNILFIVVTADFLVPHDTRCVR